MWQDNGNTYGASSSQSSYYQAPAQEPLQFYAPSANVQDSGGFYPGSRPSLEGQGMAQGNITQGNGYGGSIQPQGAWWTAFGTGGFEGEPSLLEGKLLNLDTPSTAQSGFTNIEELGINFSHIRVKSMTVLNPLQRVDEHIMDDADLAGPIIFFFCFGLFLLFSGKPNFGYIYGVGLFGAASMYTLLNLMSDHGIDAYRVASVLGYCLLPMVGISALSVGIHLERTFGYLLSLLSIFWCTYSASSIFVAVLRMSDQRLLVAYPCGLLYGCFALLSVFKGTK